MLYDPPCVESLKLSILEVEKEVEYGSYGLWGAGKGKLNGHRVSHLLNAKTQ